MGECGEGSDGVCGWDLVSVLMVRSGGVCGREWGSVWMVVGSGWEWESVWLGVGECADGSGGVCRWECGCVAGSGEFMAGSGEVQ